MTLLLSTPDGFASLGSRAYLRACAMVWLAPALLGLLALGLQWLAASQSWGDGWLMLWAFSVLLVFSPALTWFGLVLVSPLVAVLMDRGWFGYIPATALGLAVGAATAFLIGNPLAITFGAAMLVALRAILAWMCPQAFKIGPDR